MLTRVLGRDSQTDGQTQVTTTTVWSKRPRVKTSIPHPWGAIYGVPIATSGRPVSRKRGIYFNETHKKFAKSRKSAFSGRSPWVSWRRVSFPNEMIGRVGVKGLSQDTITMMSQGRHGVPRHRYSTACPYPQQRWHQSSTLLTLCEGIHWWIPFTTSQWCVKSFHGITSSCDGASLRLWVEMTYLVTLCMRLINKANAPIQSSRTMHCQLATSAVTSFHV